MNLVTGRTDTSGGLSVTPQSPKSILLIGAERPSLGQVLDNKYDTIFDINSTQEVASKFGNDSPFVGAVKTLIINGVTLIKGIIIGEIGEGAEKVDAYTKSLAASLIDNTVKVVLLDDHDTTLLPVIKSHLISAEQQDLFRYSVVGTNSGRTNTELTTLAGTINSNRIFLAGPNPVDANNNPVSGVLAATGLASVIMTQTSDPALPLNGVGILGFGGCERVLLKSEKMTLVNGGVTPLEPIGGLPTIHRLVTTYTKDGAGEPDVIWQEGTTIFIADDVLESVQKVLRAKFKRTKNILRVLDSIKTETIDVLRRKNDMEIIQNFNPAIVSVIKDPNDLYGALVGYEFEVVTPLYTVTITQHMKV